MGRDVGGPIVKDWGDYVLRDDLDHRRGLECFKDCEQAYSLFTFDELGQRRVAVYAGSLAWAIKEAEKQIKKATAAGGK